MIKPHQFLVGKDPIKKVLSCPKCGSKVEYYSGYQYMCELCKFKELKKYFVEKEIATVDWLELSRFLKDANL